ncbi:MAG: amino acid ABC transporter substrate-binding protein [Anaerolineae bacterium]|nr:amino acid ABC transporter substrate-binding protein [Anaerolineae bacterium]
MKEAASRVGTTLGNRPRRRWALGALAALLVGALAWWLFLRGADRSLERIFAQGIMRVGMDPSFPPFENVHGETGAIEGFDVDLAWALAEELGDVRPEFVVIGFDGLYDALWARRVDVCISALPVDPMLTEDVAYSRPYFNAGLRILVRADLPDVRRVEDLAGRRLGVEWGSEGDLKGRELRQELDGLELVPFVSAEDGFAALVRGEVDALLLEGVAALQFAGRPSQAVLLPELLSDQPYAVAVHPKDRALLRAVNEALEHLEEQGTLRTLQEKWFGASSGANLSEP